MGWLWTLLGGWAVNLAARWWRSRRLAYLKWFRSEVNKLLDLTESAFREQDPEIAKENVSVLIEATAKADPKVVAEVKQIVDAKSATEPLRHRGQCVHQWNKEKQQCLLCGMTFKEYDLQNREGSGLRIDGDE